MDAMQNGLNTSFGEQMDPKNVCQATCLAALLNPTIFLFKSAKKLNMRDPVSGL